MRFFADGEHEEDPRGVAADSVALLAEARRLPGGPSRHAAVAAALVRAGELAQALGDAAAAGACGRALERSALAEVARIARGLWRSYQAGGRARPPEPSRLVLADAPATVRVRRPEGYALYAVYPEPYALAGRALRGRRATCIGVRSIGTGLAGMVAAGAGSLRSIVAVRPSGHPFARTLDPHDLDPALAGTRGPFAIVDEGPGLSGSTLAAVARALLARGVPARSIHLFTSHSHPPGPEGGPAVRALLASLPRHSVPLEELLARPGLLSPATLAEELVGPARMAGDLGDGAWRGWLLPEAEWPPSTGWMERRKLLVEARGATWLARFAGLGREGERKLDRARALAEAGLGIAPAGLRHGWLFERWEREARPAAGRVPRARLLDALRRLVRLVAARPRPGEGASPAQLAAMVRANAAEALGARAGDQAGWVEELVPRVAEQARPVEVDAKLHRWEWLALPGGRLAKADALDHHAGHELSGCQDVLWDVAAAEAELGLSPGEALRLAELGRAHAPGADPSLLPFYQACYLAQELGRWWTAARACPPGEELRRREAACDRYRRLLGRALSRAPRRSPRRAARRVEVAGPTGAAVTMADELVPRGAAVPVRS